MQRLDLNLCVLYLHKFIHVDHQLFKLLPKSDMGMSSRTLRNITLLASNSTNGLLDIILKSVQICWAKIVHQFCWLINDQHPHSAEGHFPLLKGKNIILLLDCLHLIFYRLYCVWTWNLSTKPQTSVPWDTNLLVSCRWGAKKLFSLSQLMWFHKYDSFLHL